MTNYRPNSEVKQGTAESSQKRIHFSLFWIVCMINIVHWFETIKMIKFQNVKYTNIIASIQVIFGVMDVTKRRRISFYELDTE